MTSRKTNSLLVRDLIRESQKSEDDVFMSLWLGGLWEYDEPGKRIRVKDVEVARRLVGAIQPQKENRIGYWLDVLGLDQVEFEKILVELQITVSEGARNLPKNSLHKLRKYSKTLTSEKLNFDKAADSEAGTTNPELAIPEWEIVGVRSEIKYLTIEQVNEIYAVLEKDYANSDDPVATPGVRSEKLLDSALNRPMMAEDKYPTVPLALSAVVHGIIKNHPFPNGNKRTAVIAMLVMLDENGFTLGETSEEEIFKFAYRVSSSTLLEHAHDNYLNLWEHETLAMARWIEAHSSTKAAESRVRELKMGNLKRILTSLGCSLKEEGSTLKISRTVNGSSLFFGRDRNLSFKIRRLQDGVEVDKGLIATIRKNLELDADHGCSNAVFYSKEPVLPSEFVSRYSSLIRRLARF